jgi:hypothetical protein
MLTGYHRERFNRLGAARWSGFVYGGPRILHRVLKPVVYHGPMGVAPFQKEQRDRSAATMMWAGALIPLLVAAGVVALPFAFVTTWALVLPAAVLVLLCGYAACVATATPVSVSEPSPWRLRTLVGVLHLLQPLARMWGRLRGRPLPSRDVPERPWTGNREEWLLAIYRDLSAHWCAVRRGSPHSSWDIEVRVGPQDLGSPATSGRSSGTGRPGSHRHSNRRRCGDRCAVGVRECGSRCPGTPVSRRRHPHHPSCAG